jgi:hypothetical protein
MKRTLISAAICLSVLCLASFALANEKKPKAGPITGTWECTAHGGPQGDLPFTLYLEQAKEIVVGSVSSPMGGTQISSGSFKKKTLEIQIDAPQTTYRLTGKLKKGQLTGEWSGGTDKGTWEGKKQPAQPAT